MIVCKVHLTCQAFEMYIDGAYNMLHLGTYHFNIWCYSLY